MNIINNACTDDVEFTSFMSKPISTLSTTNEYIKSINSEFSFQLAEMTLFKFPFSDERKPIFYTRDPRTEIFKILLILVRSGTRPGPGPIGFGPWIPDLEHESY